MGLILGFLEIPRGVVGEFLETLKSTGFSISSDLGSIVIVLDLFPVFVFLVYCDVILNIIYGLTNDVIS